MSDFTLAFPEPRTDEEYRTAIDTLLDEIRRLNSHIQNDQSEIERTKLEIRLLQSETNAIKSRTQARLAALEATL